MREIFSTRNCLTFVVVLAISLLALFLGPTEDAEGKTLFWYSILPPLIAITFAVVTARIIPSLIVAVVLGGLLNTVPDAPLSVRAWGQGIDIGMGFIGASIGDPVNLQLLIFITLVLSMIAIAIMGGGLQGVVQWLSKFAKGPRSAQAVTALLGVLIFIDDYANTMIVGTAMRPITDTYKISREKLAFIVDSTSAPIAGLAVISTWVGYEVGLFADQSEALGLGLNGYDMLFDALPFRFYCILMLVFVFLMIWMGGDFGPMHEAESRSRKTGALTAADAVPMTSETFSTASPHPAAQIRAITAVIPIGVLFATLLGGIWIDGGGMAVLSEGISNVFHFSVWREVISASENSIKILAYAAALSVGVAAICARTIGGVDFTTIRAAIYSGSKSSLLPVTILVLAWSLKESCDSLNTAGFLVAAVGDSVNPALFPVAIFLIAALTSFATGTSFGTMAILMPTAVPIAHHLGGDAYELVTIITMGAILDGAIVGDHCSPISDTTIMSSIASSCDHLHHVRTQFPYSVLVAGVAIVFGYIPAGFFDVPSWICLLAATLCMAVMIRVMTRVTAQSA